MTPIDTTENLKMIENTRESDYISFNVDYDCL